jgi:hypothetical protein
VHRFTSRTDEATPLAATRENSSLAPRAIWKLPGPGRPPAPCSAKSADLAPAPRIVRPPPPTPVQYVGHAALDAVGESETSDLLEPRSAAYNFTVLLGSKSINQIFGSAARFFAADRSRARARRILPPAPRGRADLATLARARSRLMARETPGKPLPTAVPRTKQRAGRESEPSRSRTRIRVVRRVRNEFNGMGDSRGAPYHPLRRG